MSIRHNLAADSTIVIPSASPRDHHGRLPGYPAAKALAHRTIGFPRRSRPRLQEHV